MASQPLNQRIRKEILRKVLDNRYGEEMNALAEELRLIGVEILDDILKPLKKALDALPEMFLVKETSWSFYIDGIGGCEASFYPPQVEGGKVPPRVEVERPIPNPGWGQPWNHQYSYKVTNRLLAKKYAVAHAKAGKLQELRKVDKQEAEAILASIRTVKQLKEHWPEVMPLLPEEIAQDGSSRLLMVVTKDLNKRLNLPPKLELLKGGKEA